MLLSTLAGLRAVPPPAEQTPAPTAVSAETIEAALQKEATLTVWTWTPQLEAQVAAFEKTYPNVNVKLVNAGTGNDQYTKLQNAIKAGSGAPDVAQIEYYALPQFALSDSLVDLDPVRLRRPRGQTTPPARGARSPSTAASTACRRTPAPWRCSTTRRVFDKYGIEVPTTWDEYIAAAEKLHAADPKAYITNDTGDAGFTTSMIWQAGGQPFSADGTERHDRPRRTRAPRSGPTTGTSSSTASCVAPIAGWSDEWYKGLGDGTIATLIIGAWMPGDLESRCRRRRRQLACGPDADLRRQARSPPRTAAAARPCIKQSKNQGSRPRLPQVAQQRPRGHRKFLAARRIPLHDRRARDSDEFLERRAPSTSVARRSTRCSSRPPRTSSRDGSTCRSRCTRTASSATPSASPTGPTAT